MKSKAQLLLILIIFSFSVDGQVTDTTKKQGKIIIKRSLDLLTSISFGKYTFAEIGISKYSNTETGQHPFSSAYFASSEIKLGNKLIIGPKIGAWASGGVGGIAMGLNMIYYTDFGNSSLVFRPEIGLGLQGFKLVYGYNANLSKSRLDGINENIVGFTYCWKLKRLPNKIRSK